MPPQKLQPAALGGLFIGVLSALPLVSLGNCCCLWILGGGFLAAYLMQQDHALPITVADGALVGLLAGVFGAAVSTVLSIPISLLMGPFQERVLRQLSTGNALPPEMREMVESMSTMRGSLGIRTFIGFVITLVFYGLFAPVGGILGALFIARRAGASPPPAAMDGATPTGF